VPAVIMENVLKSWTGKSYTKKTAASVNVK